MWGECNECSRSILPLPSNFSPYLFIFSFFFPQVYVLIYREYALAFRDPTLYYFQIIMLSMFAFMSGAVFWMLPQVLNNNWNM